MNVHDDEELGIDFGPVDPDEEDGFIEAGKQHREYPQNMEPPWNVFEYPQTSMGWRMGGGEDYRSEWHEWFEHLSQEQQQAYIAQYPEPEGWFYMYPQTSVHREKDGIARANQTKRLRTTYCELHEQLSMLYEEVGHYEHAVIHLAHVVTSLFSFNIWDAEREEKTVTRYIGLKQQLNQQMKWHPLVQESWKMLRDEDCRILVTPQQTVLMPKDYERLQHRVFLPLDFGRTWTKYFERDTLYIHRYWREPCLFQVNLQEDEEGYRIHTAWMNTASTFSQPLAKLPLSQEPSMLLTLLLSWFIKSVQDS